MIELLNAVYWAPWQAILSLDAWTTNLIMAILLLAKMVFGGWVLAKGGRSLLINGADILALWVYAYVRWPFVDRSGDVKPAQTADHSGN